MVSSHSDGNILLLASQLSEAFTFLGSQITNSETETNVRLLQCYFSPACLLLLVMVTCCLQRNLMKKEQYLWNRNQPHLGPQILKCINHNCCLITRCRRTADVSLFWRLSYCISIIQDVWISFKFLSLILSFLGFLECLLLG